MKSLLGFVVVVVVYVAICASVEGGRWFGGRGCARGGQSCSAQPNAWQGGGCVSTGQCGVPSNYSAVPNWSVGQVVYPQYVPEGNFGNMPAASLPIVEPVARPVLIPSFGLGVPAAGGCVNGSCRRR